MRRAHLLAFVAASLAAAALVGADAFTAADAAPRDVVAEVVSDGDAYLALAADPTSPHECFVAPLADGRLSVSFGANAGCAGAGSGINGANAAGGEGRHTFHDLLVLTNQGTKAARVWVNATTTSASGSLLEVAAKTTSGSMAAADYGTARGPHVLQPGESLHLGLRVSSGQLAPPASVTGRLSVEARAALG